MNETQRILSKMNQQDPTNRVDVDEIEYQPCQNCGSDKQYNVNDLYRINSERFDISDGIYLEVCNVCAFELGVKWLIKAIDKIINKDNVYVKKRMVEILDNQGSAKFFELSKRFLENLIYLLSNNSFVHKRAEELNKIYDEIIKEYRGLDGVC